jgi:hypothetical protein
VEIRRISGTAVGQLEIKLQIFEILTATSTPTFLWSIDWGVGTDYYHSVYSSSLRMNHLQGLKLKVMKDVPPIEHCRDLVKLANRFPAAQ